MTSLEKKLIWLFTRRFINLLRTVFNWLIFLLNKILVPIDFSENSIRALGFAVDLAKKLKASITLLNVVYSPVLEVSSEWPFPWGETVVSDWKKNNEQALGELVKKTKEQEATLEISHLIKEGQPADQIVNTASEFDFIVIGQKGRSVPGTLMGGVIQRVAQLANCPVVIVP